MPLAWVIDVKSKGKTMQRKKKHLTSMAIALAFSTFITTAAMEAHAGESSVQSDNGKRVKFIPLFSETPTNKGKIYRRPAPATSISSSHANKISDIELTPLTDADVEKPKKVKIHPIPIQGFSALPEKSDIIPPMSSAKAAIILSLFEDQHTGMVE